MFKKLISATALSTVILVNSPAFAGGEHNGKKPMPYDHAPIGVMGDHFHKQGEIMFSYRNARMLMKGMKDGDSSVTPASIVAAGGAYGYVMTPTKMTMDMHMLGAMYAPSNDVTLMLMGHYMDKNMDMLNRAGVTSKMESKGFGDTSISALYKLNDQNSNPYFGNMHANIGLSLPTGSTDEKGVRMGSYGNLPYAMQLGSGTYDPTIGLTYSSSHAGKSWGMQAKGTFRFGKNDEGYRLGNEYKFTTWTARHITDWLSASLRLEAKHKGKIDGQDTSIGAVLPTRVPTFDTNNYGGKTIELALGFNLIKGEGKLKGHRLALEYSMPVYEDLNGPQMSTQNTVWLGWQYAF